MLFVEYRFFAFFLIVLAVYWSLRSDRRRKMWLLLCSYAFYAGWDWRFLGLIVVSTLVDFLVGLRLARPDAVRRKAWLLLSLGVNLGLLAFFKYFNFFVESASDLLQFLGLPASPSTLAIILPVGISFYTFQTLSYSIDIYRGKLEASRSLLDVALFVGFFPQLVAGPIVRARDFLPQLSAPRRYATVDLRGCLLLFLVGFVKKACISDNIAPIVDQYFADPSRFDAISAWVGVSFYAVQIYCDFSGYSDMAIACAGLLGYRLLLNFDFPYLASNITIFWRRWHISLSSWLRDYLYIPLGGSKGTKLFTYRNLLLTMLLGGLWHGAAWNFVIWGGLHGTALIVHKEWCRRFTPPGGVALALKILGPFLTFYWVCIAWIFFRAQGFDRALEVARSFVLFQAEGEASLGAERLWIFVALAVVHWLSRTVGVEGIGRRLPSWGFAIAYGFLAAVALSLIPASFTPFIYFQF
jgi:alginate O-acetyltransferase complex protein AlgI